MKDILFSTHKRDELWCRKCKGSILDCLCVDLVDNKEGLSREISTKKLDPEREERFRERLASLRGTLEKAKQDLN